MVSSINVGSNLSNLKDKYIGFGKCIFLDKFVLQEFEKMQLEEFIDKRFKNQSYELTIKYGPNFINDFHILHSTRYGFYNFEKEVKIVTLRLKAVIKKSDLKLSKLNNKEAEDERKRVEVFINNK